MNGDGMRHRTPAPTVPAVAAQLVNTNPRSASNCGVVCFAKSALVVVGAVVVLIWAVLALLDSRPATYTGSAITRVLELKDGRNVSFTELGDERGFLVFFCHASASSRLQAERGRAKLVGSGVRVVVPDRPGNGMSDKAPTGDWRVTSWVDDFDQLLEHFAVPATQPFGLVGFSGGAPFAMAVAAKYGTRVSRLILLNGVAPPSMPKFSESFGPDLLKVLSTGQKMPSVLKGFSSTFGQMLYHYYDSWNDKLKDGMSDDDRQLFLAPDADELWMAVRNATQESVRANGAAGVVSDFIAFGKDWGFDLANIKSPTDIWHGEHDNAIFAAHSRYLATLLPHATLRVMADAGHFWTGYNFNDAFLMCKPSA